MRIFKVNSNFESHKDLILQHILNFNNSGTYFVKGQRNSIKLFDLDQVVLNIKSFKKPNLLNKIIYRYFRKTKAKRSFEYASTLMNLGIGTPKPIAFFESFDALGLNESFYVCEHLTDVFEFRALVQNKDFQNKENILRQFVYFMYYMHEKGVEFLDNSPGNTLIKDNKDGTYSFYLVDLNRMRFHSKMSFDLRMKNLSRLTPLQEMVQIMSNEYAKHYSENEEAIFQRMWSYTEAFQRKYHRKQNLKKKFKK